MCTLVLLLLSNYMQALLQLLLDTCLVYFVSVSMIVANVYIQQNIYIKMVPYTWHTLYVQPFIRFEDRYTYAYFTDIRQLSLFVETPSPIRQKIGNNSLRGVKRVTPMLH